MMLESHQSYEFELDDNVSESERGVAGQGVVRGIERKYVTAVSSDMQGLECGGI